VKSYLQSIVKGPLVQP